MRLPSICISFCAWFVLGFATFASTQESVKPLAFVEEPIYRFGSVIEGDNITHEFRIENKGTADLVIDRVESG